MDDYERKQIEAAYKFVCRKCGSEQVTINYEPPHHYSEHTVSSANLSLTCHGCHQNDLVLFLN